MSKRYQIRVGKKKPWIWESNIIQDKVTMPLRLEESKDHCFDTKERIFCLQSLDENINPPHQIGEIIFFTEAQAKDISEKLLRLAQEAKE